MPPILNLKPLSLAFLVLLSLALLPATASAQITLSVNEASSSDTITFSGSVYALTCQNGNGHLRMLLKEPGGRYRTDVKFSYSRNAAFVPPNIVDLSFDVSGSMDIDDSWPNGEYELMSDVIYTCSGSNWIARGDRIESVKFRVSGNSGPEDNVWHLGSSTITPPVGQSGTFTKTFTMNEMVQTSLKVSAYRSATCYVNGQQVASGITSQRTIDITPYLKLGDNIVRCDVSAGIEKECSWTYKGYDNCGCYWWKGTVSSCPSNVVCTYRKGVGDYCYIPVTPYFEVSVSAHRPTDILWSNDNSNWYYGSLPIQSDSWWLEKPNFYNSDETIYTGIHPWSGGKLYLRKWLFKEDASEGVTQWLDFSSTSSLSCTINGQKVEMTENDDDWWLYSTEVTSMPDNMLLECTSPQNSIFNIFDVRFFQESPFVAPPAEPPGTPFAFDTGSSSNTPSVTGWMSQSVSGIQNAASGIPAAPVAAAATAVGALGVTNYMLSRRRLSGKNGGAASFWSKISQLGQKYKEKLESIARNNENWLTLKEDLRQKELKENQAAESRNAVSFLSSLTGTAAERASKITAALRSGVFRSEQTIRLLNQTVSQYENMTLNATMLGIQNMTNSSTGEKGNETGFLEDAKDAINGFVAWAVNGFNTVKERVTGLWKLFEKNYEKIEPWAELGEDMYEVMFSEPFQAFFIDEKSLKKKMEKCKAIATKEGRKNCTEDAFNEENNRALRKNILGVVRDGAYIYQSTLTAVIKQTEILNAKKIITGAGIIGGTVVIASVALAEFPITIGSGFGISMMGSIGIMPVKLQPNVGNGWTYGMTYSSL